MPTAQNLYCDADTDLKPLLAVGTVDAVTWGEGPYPAASVVDAMIERKSRTIDAVCRDKYTVPFTAVPGPVADLCILLCLADLLPQVHRDVPEQLTRARGCATDAKSLIAQIQQNQISLQAEDQASEGMAGGPVVTSSAATERLFSMADPD